MAIKRQNRVILALFVMIFGLLAIFWFQQSKIQHETPRVPLELENVNLPGESTSEEFEIDNRPSSLSAEAVTFAEIIADLSNCMDVRETGGLTTDAQGSIQALIWHFEESLGNAQIEVDKWKEWDILRRDHSFVRLRLELKEKVGVGYHRELYETPLQRISGGQAFEKEAVLLPKASDEAIDDHLKRGEVQKESRGAFIQFLGGERIDFVEVQGKLVEIEFTKNQKVFRCDQITSRESCQCLR